MAYLTGSSMHKVSYIPSLFVLDEGCLRAVIIHDSRNRRLNNLTKRIENEIEISENKQENIKQEIVTLQYEIQRKKESTIEHEESMQKLKLSIVSEQILLQSVRKKLEDLKYEIRKLYREEESITEKLNNSMRGKRTIRDELASKRVEIKGRELLENELVRKYERVAGQIRLLHTDARHQTSEIIEIEKKIQEDTFKLRNLKKDLSKEVSSLNELNETLTGLKQNQDKTLSLPSLPCYPSQKRRLTFSSAVTEVNPPSSTSFMKVRDPYECT